MIKAFVARVVTIGAMLTRVTSSPLTAPSAETVTSVAGIAIHRGRPSKPHVATRQTRESLSRADGGHVDAPLLDHERLTDRDDGENSGERQHGSEGAGRH